MTEPVARGPLALGQLLRRLFALSGLVVLLAAGAGALSLKHLVDGRVTVVERIAPAEDAVSQLLVGYLNQETGLRGYVATRQTDFLQPYTEGLTEVGGSEKQIQRLLPKGPLHAAAMTAIAAGRQWSTQYGKPALAGLTAGQAQWSTAASAEQGQSYFDHFRSTIATLQGQLAADRRSADRSLAVSTHQLIAVGATALVVILADGILIWLALHQLVLRPIAAVATDTRRITSGELGHPVEPTGPREVADLASDVNAMRNRILAEVTAVKESESRLAALNDELTRSNQDLEQFAYVASHDLQEPLRKVTSFCQLIEQRYGDKLDERGVQYIDFAVDGARRMQDLINDLLAFSRIGRTTDRFTAVALGDCVEAATRNLAVAIEQSAVTVVKENLPVVWGDRTLLSTLMQNLIGNAVKFHSDEPPFVKVSAIADGDDWTISVTDNGIGIEPRFAEKIFVIFQRLHSRDTYAGTGIGLAMCRKIVEFHGGRMWLDISHSPGTRFCFTMPLVPTEVTSSDQPAHAG